ncbi:diguanylate cyclase [Noviherbaspirillum aerium]|uniref:diguanylate cyclase n=1 Tax=Noviherbaspirillum aerium TaxID=2588497 RepID=UPI00178C3725|nr:diguanylate cyclase [Noviherbaspirillum aerium]
MNTGGSLISHRLLPLIQRVVPEHLRGDVRLMSRTENLLVAMALSTLVIPGYAVFYQWHGHSVNATFCLLACIPLFTSPVLLRVTGRLGLAREVFVAGIFGLLLALTYELDGIMAPTVIWLAVCPLIATAAGGRMPGYIWSAISMSAVAGIYACDRLGLIPPTTFGDIRLLQAVSTVSFVTIVACFLMVYERITAMAIVRLDQALVKINELAIRDELTGAFNRRELLRLAERERQRAARSGAGFCLCLIDIDHFKEINDRHGHAAGDLALKQVVRQVQGEIRRIDMFGRYGGEEFLLLLVDAEMEDARVLVERVRQSIEGMMLPGSMAGERLTVSIGIVRYRMPEAIDQTVSRADAALYHAKHTGRNRVVLGDEPERWEAKARA